MSDHREAIPAVEQAVRDAEAALGVRITIRDDAGFFADSAGASLLGPQRRSHRPIPVCGIGFDRRCIEHCRHAVGMQAAAAGSPFVHHCWKGVSELVVPVVAGGAVRALLFAGGWRRAARPPASATGLPAGWAVRFRRLPRFQPAPAVRLGRMLTVFAGGLARLREAQDAEGGSRRASVSRYVGERHATGATLAGLARELGLSPSRTGHLVAELFGQPLGALVRAERMARARALLITTDLSVGEVGRRVGMGDEYHFNRSFSRAVGMPPGRFRRQSRNGSTGA